jgi:hypothetical protein
MTARQTSSNAAVRAALTILGERRDAAVLGLAPGNLRGKKIRAALLEEFEGRCAYCEKTLKDDFHVDHMVPMNRASLGLHMYGNLVPACMQCNGDKKALTLEVFIQKTKLPKGKSIQTKLQKRAVKYGADLDSKQVKQLMEAMYQQISDLIFQEAERAFKMLPAPSSETLQAATKIQRKSEYDFSEISKKFPIGVFVKSRNDGTFGEVCDYSLQGPKKNRQPYVTYIPIGGGKALRRAPSTLEIIKNVKPNNDLSA